MNIRKLKQNKYMETTQVKIEERLQNNLKAAFEYCLKHELIINNVDAKNNSVLELFSQDITDAAIRNISANRRKKLAKALRRLEYKPTLKSVNLFFHFLNTKLEIPVKIKVQKSFKEQKIDKLRQTYKELRQMCEQARVEFKKEKVGFYTK